MTDVESPSWDAHHAALGALVVEWGKVEMFLATLFENMANLDPFLADLLTDRRNAETLIKHCRVLLLGFALGTDQKKVADWLTEAEVLRKKRNDMIHSRWVYYAKEDASPVVIAKQSVDVNWKTGHSSHRVIPTTAAEVDALTARVNKLVKAGGHLPVRDGHRPRVVFTESGARQSNS
jgi:hypothetical protein